jgi:hypothetical protein
MECEEVQSTPRSFSSYLVAGLIALWLTAGALGFYAYHEHTQAKARTAQNQQISAENQEMSAENQQMNAELAATRQQLADLSQKVSALTASERAPAAPAPHPTLRHTTTSHRSEPSRWKKMQSQLDAQNKAIQATQAQIASTQSDLSNTRTELTGSIARTHDELVLLEKKGERNYYEFDTERSKQFQHDGPFGVRLRKANTKHQYADLELLVDDRTLSQKHVNLYQPVMFYTPDNPQPVELVINSITRDHIHGYVSAPRYRQSELASMANANTSTAGSGPTGSDTPSARQKLPPPQ